MADKYVPIFFDWIEATQELKAQEKGRLIDAIVLYARGGDWSELLEGNERYVFPIFRLQIDRAREISKAKAEAGADGGKQSQAKASKAKQNQAKPSKAKQSQAKPSYNNNNENNNEYKNNNENEEEHHHDDDAREDFNTIQVYAANNLTFMSPGNLEELTGFVEILPDDVIRFAIDEACANGAPRWAYVSAILRGYVKDGIKTVGDAKAAKDKRKTAAGAPQNPVTQTYQAHGYTDADYGEDFFIDLSKENERG